MSIMTNLNLKIIMSLAKFKASIFIASFVVLFYMFLPLYSYFHNINEFVFGGRQLALAIFYSSFIVFFAGIGILIISEKVLPSSSFTLPFLNKKIETKAGPFHSLILILILLCLLETLVLNFGLAELDGTLDVFTDQIRIVWDSLLWIILMVLSLLFWKKILNKMVPIVLILSFFMVGSIVSAWNVKVPKLKTTTDRSSVLKDSQFSSNKNILLILLDTVSTDMMEEIFDTVPEIKSKMKGFTFFRDNLTPAGSTAFSLPPIFAGKPFDGGDFYKFSQQSLYANDSLLQSFVSRGYSTFSSSIVKFFNYNSNVNFTKDSFKVSIKDISLLIFSSVPYVMKESISRRIFIGFGDFNITEVSVGPNVKGDLIILNLLKEKTRNLVSEKTFQYHHLYGAHSPITLNKNGVEITPTHDHKKSLEQVHFLLKQIIKIMESLKENDIYDKTTLVLLGDHGKIESHSKDYSQRIKGLEHKSQGFLMIKPGNSFGSLKYSDAPMTTYKLKDLLLELDSSTKGEEKKTLTTFISKLENFRYYYKKQSNEFFGIVRNGNQYKKELIETKSEINNVVELDTLYTTAKKIMVHPFVELKGNKINPFGDLGTTIDSREDNTNEFTIQLPDTIQPQSVFALNLRFKSDPEKNAPDQFILKDLVSNSEVEYKKREPFITLEGVKANEKNEIKIKILFTGKTKRILLYSLVVYDRLTKKERLIKDLEDGPLVKLLLNSKVIKRMENGDSPRLDFKKNNLIYLHPGSKDATELILDLNAEYSLLKLTGYIDPKLLEKITNEQDYKNIGNIVITANLDGKEVFKENIFKMNPSKSWILDLEGVKKLSFSVDPNGSNNSDWFYLRIDELK